MEMNPDAPGNVSQKGVNSDADNETGFDHRSQGQADPSSDNGKDVGDELGFDPDSPDLSDPAVDPLHPARTSNDPVPSGKRLGSRD
ncbi:hypothetical protein EC915_103216 [Pseudomonas sp. LP_7_YM]|nr:hypothetical protein EC915_103216 [Pseudomonas sp. LP_7_YM]